MCAGHRRAHRAAVRERARPPAASVGCAPVAAAGARPGRRPGPLAACAPAHVRDPFAGGRSRPAQHPGDARPRISRHNPGIHPRECPPSEGGAPQRTSTRVMTDESADIWSEYKRTGEKRLRDRLILTYAPLVKYVAGRLGTGLPAHVDEGDLVSYGLLGLMNAIERFDPSRDIKFETYAISRVKGAIIDELRAMDWVPRSVRARARDIERAIAELERKLRRAPTDAEIAGKLGVSESELGDALSEISRSSIAALDELWTISSSGGDQVALIDTLEDADAPNPQ